MLIHRVTVALLCHGVDQPVASKYSETGQAFHHFISFSFGCSKCIFSFITVNHWRADET